jgi:hypothetical protein
MNPLKRTVSSAIIFLITALIFNLVVASGLPQPQPYRSLDTAEDHSIILKNTPQPNFPPEINTDIELAVTLLATFKKDRKVSDVKVISSRVPAFIPAVLVAKLEKATVDAAKRIEFTPATSNGRPITQRVELLFTFKRVKEKQYLNWRPQIAE